MQEQLISFETAKLAKEKGFNLNSHAYYGCDNPVSGESNKLILREWEKWVNFGKEDSPQDGTLIYSAPTQSLLQKWLREKHNIHIEINEIPIKNDENIIHKFYIVLRGLKHELNLDDDDQGNWYPILSKTHTGYEVFKTYEEALEIGLQEALKLI